MAVSIVVEAALNALIDGIFDKLALPFLKRRLGFLCGGVDEEMKKLSRTLLRIQSFLSDAEDRQIQEEAVKLWLSDLKDVAYDAEDIIDEFTTEALRSSTQSPIQTRKRKRVNDFFSYLGSSSTTSQYSIECRIKEIRERLDEIESERDQLRLKVRDRGRRLQSRDRLQTSSLVDESIIVGRVDDREKIVDLLRSDQSRAGNGVLVVPIVGMGGLGKTTLAQLVYNDKRIEKHFDLRAWVCASEDFDSIRLTRAIVESLTGSPCHLMNLDPLQVALVKKLKGKKFLLVLDNVWNVKRSDWDELRAPLMVGLRGSGILVTTRSQDVLSIMGTGPPHFLQGLSDDDCWFLFERLAFIDGNSNAHPNLVTIGKEIVNKCKGLPLAVKTLGGLLFSKLDEEEWIGILKSDIWDLPEDRNGILPALRLSYHHLPAHLKQCFAYCSIFPKGQYFKKDILVLLWMAEGFIQPKGNNQMEDIGGEYLADLASRSFFRYEYTNWEDQELYTMHDLLHDLAQSISGVEYIRMEDGKSCGVVDKVRHLSYDWFSMGTIKFEAFYGLKSLRTLLLSSVFDCIQHVPYDLFINLSRIRVLDLGGTRIPELPDSIGKLIHLRYLDLSSTRIKRLPKSTTRLYNLQTLRITGCGHIVELPDDLSNLVNLRHLHLGGTGHRGSVSIPLRIGKLTCLQTLDMFNVGKEIGHGINELKDMIHLRGEICISLLENVVNVEEVKEAELKSKQELRKLKLRWKSYDVDSRQEGTENAVLEGLQPDTNLKVLEITGYCSVAFPRWMGDSSFSNLVHVSLAKCKCLALPPFGQLPFLKELHIDELYGLKKMGQELYGDGIVKGFPSLETLILKSMPDWEEWSGEEGDISHVSDITISHCSELRGLPPFPPTLKQLSIDYCEKLVSLPCVSSVRGLSLWGCDEVILGSFQHLTSLSSLSISYFPNITSLPEGFFLPLTVLEKLHIHWFPGLMSLSEEVGLQDITSLRLLEISECPQLTSLGDEVLPNTLWSLKISGCSNLKCLPKGLQKLVSFVVLEIMNCPEIHSLPEERLPTTLQMLDISGCPSLKEKCQRDGGEDWGKIAHIPNISIDGVQISTG